MEELHETQQYAGRDRRESQQKYDGPDRRKSPVEQHLQPASNQPTWQKPETD